MQTVVIYHDQYFNAGYDYVRVLTVIVYFYVSINLSRPHVINKNV